MKSSSLRLMQVGQFKLLKLAISSCGVVILLCLPVHWFNNFVKIATARYSRECGYNFATASAIKTGRGLSHHPVQYGLQDGTPSSTSHERPYRPYMATWDGLSYGQGSVYTANLRSSTGKPTEPAENSYFCLFPLRVIDHPYLSFAD